MSDPDPQIGPQPDPDDIAFDDIGDDYQDHVDGAGAPDD